MAEPEGTWETTVDDNSPPATLLPLAALLVRLAQQELEEERRPEPAASQPG
jgi:hypothetical protein